MLRCAPNLKYGMTRTTLSDYRVSVLSVDFDGHAAVAVQAGLSAAEDVIRTLEARQREAEEALQAAQREAADLREQLNKERERR